MAASTREQILEVVLARLRAIAQVDGFSTNAGAAVYLGEAPALGPDDRDVAIVIGIGDDAVRYQGEQLYLDLPLEIGALAKADLSAPYLAAEAVLADIKRAMELTDRTLGGLVKRQMERSPTRTLPREPGSTAVGVAITYVCPYTEVWGNP